MKKPVGIWLTDTHLSMKTININLSIYRQVIKLAHDLGVNKIYHGGDIFESRTSQPQEVLYIFNHVLDLMHERGLNMFVIPGNHDKTDYRSEKSFLTPYRSHKAITLVESFHIDNINNNLSVYMLPYFDEKIQLKSRLESLEKLVDTSKKSIGMFHAAFKGVRNNDGSIIDINLKPSKFDLSLVGHYHDRQIIDSNLIYTGSTHQACFGENQEKGFTIIYDDGSTEHVKSSFRGYQTLRIDKPSSMDVENIKNLLEENNVKLVTSSINSELKNDLVTLGVKVLNKSKNDFINPFENVVNNEDLVTIFEKWCKSIGKKNIGYGLNLIKKILK